MNTSEAAALRVDFCRFDPADPEWGLVAILQRTADLHSPPLLRSESQSGFGSEPGHVFGQLEYIESYVRDLGCLSLAIEQHYIDRDYMEDYSVFYSRNFHQYPNWCRRVHFFTVDQDQVQEQLKALVRLGHRDGKEAFVKGCARFSQECYLGFSVLKPLGGSPVGRTVLRGYPEDTEEGHRRYYDCTRLYHAHLLGAELSVLGLAFQQQDLGVSACATTALWSALHKSRDFEEIGGATPAQITLLASRYALPAGRAMPSEGLNVDQMCQAVQALGMSPNLLRAGNYEATRGYLHSATASGFAAVLILKDEHLPPNYHAVTATGRRVDESRQEPLTINGNPAREASDRACSLVALYLHDDRVGPSVRADLVRSPSTKPGEAVQVRVNRGTRQQPHQEAWTLTHVLVPLHPKIRLSFAGLRETALRIVDILIWYQIAAEIDTSAYDSHQPLIIFDTWIERGTTYTKRLLMGPNAIDPGRFEQFIAAVHLARYLGVIRVVGPHLGSIDIVVDTTSTARNLHFLGIVATGLVSSHTQEALQLLSEECQCAYVL